MVIDSRIEAGRTARTDHVLAVGLRLTAGVLWLSNVGWKTPPSFGESGGRCSGLCGFVDEGTTNAVVPGWGWLLEHLVAPHLAIFGYLTLAVEFLLAVLLLSGTLTKAAALLGLGQSIAIGLTVANAAGEWYWSYLLMAALHVAIIATAAGRYYGVDALIRARRPLPRWLEIST